MSSIITLTVNPALDKSTAVEQVVPERKLRCDDYECFPGGGGINVARAIKILGGEATAYWTRGGAAGDKLEELLAGEGVAQHPLPIDAATRENVIVCEESGSRQFRFCLPGGKLTATERHARFEQLAAIDPAPEYLVLSGSLPPGGEEDFYARIVRAISARTRIVLDTSGPALRGGLCASVFLVKPNLRELEQLAGRPIKLDAQIREAARSLIDRRRMQVVVTSLGAGGAVLTTKDGHWQIRAPKVPIRSKVGAGDGTVGGTVLGLSAGKELVDAVRYGVAAGAAAVMTEGAELRRKEDANHLYREMTESAAATV